MSGAKAIRRVVRDVSPHWVGDGFPVRSLFSYQQSDEFDPFLLLDYAGPHEFAPDREQRGIGEHPHRGFETVTIVYQGELEHRDSSGSRGTIGAGDVQWMTAASGVVHEEFHSRRFAEQGGTLEMVQLWVNLPAARKMSPPRYQEIRDERVPQVALPDGAGTVRVIAGRFGGAAGAAETFTPINLWDLQLAGDGSTELQIPDGHTSLVVVQHGGVEVNDTALRAVEMALFEAAGTSVQVSAKAPARLLVLSGEPLSEPVEGHGPFVMNTREEIHQAIRDYQAGRMGTLSADGQ